MLQTPLFTKNDLKLVRELVYNPDLEPGFNALSGYLTWDDELPSGITPDGLDVLQSLWTARSLLHRGLVLSDHPINPDYCQRVWNMATEEIPNWPGFKRLTLNEVDQSYYQEMLAKQNPFD